MRFNDEGENQRTKYLGLCQCCRSLLCEEGNKTLDPFMSYATTRMMELWVWCAPWIKYKLNKREPTLGMPEKTMRKHH